MSSSSAFFFLFLLLPLIFSIAKAQVPPSETFKLVNEGEMGRFFNEYGSFYRLLNIFNPPFQLAFYNTTPDAFTLALRLGDDFRNDPHFHWVWEANRGKPVRENATFSLGTDGNLVLAEADGTVVWQTNTANKGVVGFKLLPNGNMVLLDSKGNFIWQSFDYPTDTVLVGQSLRVGGINKLVSRASAKENVDGPYSFVLEYPGFVLYYKTKNSREPARYLTSSEWFKVSGISNATFTSVRETFRGSGYQLGLSMSDSLGITFTRVNYNSTISFMRLGIDGNLKIYTFYNKIPLGWSPVQVTFTLLDRESNWDNECQLPEKCGKLGVCEDSQCVACPTEKGLIGWSKECEARKITACGTNQYHYYKVEGVDHFSTKYTKGLGPMKVEDCEKLCNKYCKCSGYFYHTETSRCWIAYDLNTVTKFPNSTHVGYIKVPNK